MLISKRKLFIYNKSVTDFEQGKEQKMAHEIFSAKLGELDEKFSALHRRIQKSEELRIETLEEDIRLLEKECEAERLTIRSYMRDSRARTAELLLEAYDEIEEVLRDTKEEIGGILTAGEEGEMSAENLTLLAEYMLDFALQAANGALLISLKAIQAQRESI